MMTRSEEKLSMVVVNGVDIMRLTPEAAGVFLSGITRLKLDLLLNMSLGSLFSMMHHTAHATDAVRACRPRGAGLLTELVLFFLFPESSESHKQLDKCEACTFTHASLSLVVCRFVSGSGRLSQRTHGGCGQI